MNDNFQDAEQQATLHKIELLQMDDHSHDDYMLRSKAEILVVLRALQKEGALMTMHFNHGNDFLMSSLLKVASDGKSIVLDFGSDNEMNQRALASDKLICISKLDKVKIQFVLNNVSTIEFEGRPAFLAETPEALLRLQRREYYRLTLPIIQPLKCLIPIQKPDHTTDYLEANILDISGGGIGIIVQAEGSEFEAGMLFPDCRIELPNVGVISTTLRIRSVFEVTMRNGARVKRYGCQFIDLAAPMEVLIQRYIIKAERDRKAQEAGLL